MFVDEPGYNMDASKAYGGVIALVLSVGVWKVLRRLGLVIQTELHSRVTVG